MKIALVALSLDEFPPLALGYLKAAALNDSELKDILEFFIYDEAIDDYNQNPEKKGMLASKLAKKNPDIILFSCYLWNTKQMQELGSVLKKKSNAKIIFGGPAVTYNAEAVMGKNPFVDIIIRGEGELTFVELIKELLKDGILQNIAGITFRKDYEIINNKPRALITNLDEIPSPYLLGNLEVKEKVLIETHRGCFFRCGYCLEYKGGPIREFSVDRTRQEIKYVVERGAKKITLCNSIFNNSLEMSETAIRNLPASARSKKAVSEHAQEHVPCFSTGVLDRATALCNMLHEFKEYDLEINVDSYAEWLTKEMVELYAYGGITGTEIGLQSVNEKVLRNIRRPPLDKEKFREKIRMLDSAGIKTCLHVILGLPDETLSSFQETAKYAFSTEPTDVSFFKLLLMPGTELQRLSEKFGIKYNPEPPYEVISTSTMSSEDIKRAELFVKKAYKEFILKSSIKCQKFSTSFELVA